MNEKDCSLRQGNLNLKILFELLSHKETNYAFFAVSRIKVISKIIGTHSPLSRAQKNKRRTHSWPEEIRNNNITTLWAQSTHSWSNTLTLRKKHCQILNFQYFEKLPLFEFLLSQLAFILYLIFAPSTLYILTLFGMISIPLRCQIFMFKRIRHKFW